MEGCDRCVLFKPVGLTRSTPTLRWAAVGQMHAGPPCQCQCELHVLKWRLGKKSIFVSPNSVIGFLYYAVFVYVSYGTPSRLYKIIENIFFVQYIWLWFLFPNSSPLPKYTPFIVLSLIRKQTGK